MYTVYLPTFAQKSNQIVGKYTFPWILRGTFKNAVFEKKAGRFVSPGIWVNWARSSSARPTYWSWWPNVKVGGGGEFVKVNRGRGLFLFLERQVSYFLKATLP